MVKTIVTKAMPVVATPALSVANILHTPTAQQPQFALQTISMPHSIGLSLEQHSSSLAAAAVTADDFLMTSLGLLQQHQLQQNVMLQHHGVQNEEAKVEMPLMGVDSSNHVQSLLKSL